MKHVPYLALSVLMTLVLGFSSPARPQNTGSIEGKIVDVDGHGVSNARIGIAGTPRSARPEPSGAFRFDAVPTGDFVLESNEASAEEVERWMRFYRERIEASGLVFYDTIGNNEIAGTNNDDFGPEDPGYGNELYRRFLGPTY